MKPEDQILRLLRSQDVPMPGKRIVGRLPLNQITVKTCLARLCLKGMVIETEAGFVAAPERGYAAYLAWSSMACSGRTCAYRTADRVRTLEKWAARQVELRGDDTLIALEIVRRSGEVLVVLEGAP